MRLILRDRQQWGRLCMASTGSACATLVAIDTMTDGGNAFDAAIAVSAALCVAMPMACGPAGDMGAVLSVGDASRPLSVTSLGRAPQAADIAVFHSRGLAHLPETGWLSATTPALVDGWLAVHERLGTLPLARLLAPAIALAEHGVPVTQQVNRWIRDNVAVLDTCWLPTYAPGGVVPAVGSLLRQPQLAAFLRTVADKADAAAVRAMVAGRLAEESTRHGGLIATADLKADHVRVDDALTAEIGGMRVATTPPPTHGPLLLQNLLLYEQLATNTDVTSADGVHTLVEIVNQTFGWRLHHLGDPERVKVPDPLAPGTLADLSAHVDLTRRSPSECAGFYSEGDTTHFVTADAYGNAVSWIQSLGLGFGAGVGLPDYGLLLCNRLGRSATLDERHVNQCRPGARPVNTIFPWLVTAEDGTRWLGGTPGGDGQCQWNSQVLAALITHRTPPLLALSQNRWTYVPGSDKHESALAVRLLVDGDTPNDVVTELRRRGHDVVPKASVGGVMRVIEYGNGALYGLDDGRQEGLTAGR